MRRVAAIAYLMTLHSAASLDAAPPALQLIQKHCVRCHNEEKSRGGLDLSTREAALMGGGTGDAIVPFMPEKSLLIERTKDGSMPPEKDGRRLTKDEIDVLLRWIADGAKWEEK